MTPKAKEVGHRIRKIREAKDLNQQDMADKLKLTAGAYAKIERGETDPSVSRLYEIAGILKVNIWAILEDGSRQNKSEVTREEFDKLETEVGILIRQVTQINSNTTKGPSTKKAARKK